MMFLGFYMCQSQNGRAKYDVVLHDDDSFGFLIVNFPPEMLKRSFSNISQHVWKGNNIPPMQDDTGSSLRFYSTKKKGKIKEKDFLSPVRLLCSRVDF